ncbi:MAG: hypothetical protein AAB368_02375 [bacterium]
MPTLAEHIEYYKLIRQELTRYRDREWLNTGLFVVGAFLILDRIIAIPADRQDKYWVYEVALFALALAHMYFTLCAHIALASIRTQAEFFEVHVVPTLKFVRFRENSFWDNFRRGLFDHLALFFGANWIAVVIGVALVPAPDRHLGPQLVGSLLLGIPMTGFLVRCYFEQKAKCDSLRNRRPARPNS